MIKFYMSYKYTNSCIIIYIIFNALKYYIWIEVTLKRRACSNSLYMIQ